MEIKLTPEQQARVEFLLYECYETESITENLKQLESTQEIHEFATNYNWDYGIEPLKLILQHPLCDRGTALKIYWLGQPDSLNKKR